MDSPRQLRFVDIIIDYSDQRVRASEQKMNDEHIKFDRRLSNDTKCKPTGRPGSKVPKTDCTLKLCMFLLLMMIKHKKLLEISDFKQTSAAKSIVSSTDSHIEQTFSLPVWEN